MDYRYSFTDLFSKEVDFDKDTRVKIAGIVIPKIQRPYAQGRPDGVSTYIRNTFLDEIFENLTKDTDEEFDLNFVYGIIKQTNNEYKLELLDGQQRLTTLFLLYWYIVNAEEEIDSAESQSVRSCLAKFVYETRATSSIFCKELACNKIIFGEKSPKEVIRKTRWYFKSFDRDSTISAMLTMLDSIHERYIAANKNNLLSKLQNLQFYVKSLGMFNLSEELYIKMNARGLQLSPFENFKADLTNFVSAKNISMFEEMVPLYKKETADMVPFNANFSVKLDAKWVDIFWKNGIENFDDSYMSFFSRFFACKYIIASKEEVSDRDMRADKTIKTFYTDAENKIGTNEYFGFNAYEKILSQHPEYILSLDKVLDVLYDYDLKSQDRVIFKSMCPYWDKNADLCGDDFYCNTNAKMSHAKLIAFGAVVEFIEAMNTFDIQTYNQWMRIVWNVIENTNIDSLTPVSSLVRKFSAIVHFAAERVQSGLSFYQAISEWRMANTSERENRAVLEEVEKARRVAENSEWEEAWKDAEIHPYFKGMVTFFYTPSMSLKQFKHNADNAKAMFDANGIAETYRDKHLLIRAIVSQYTRWEEINELYITENAERNKFLKNILASNDKVRNMLATVLQKDSILEIKEALNEYIRNAEEPIAWQNADEKGQRAMSMAVKRLRNDILMYDWISQEEKEKKSCFRIYWYLGHIMFAIPRRQYAKIALDTERAKIADSLCADYGFEYDDENQQSMYNTYHDCFGREVWLSQDRKGCTLWIGFLSEHRLVTRIVCNTKKYAKELYNTLENCEYMEDTDEKILELPELYHSSKQSTYKKLCKVVDDVFEIIPEK